VDYIQLAIPVFFLLIGIELVLSRLLARDSYRLNDSFSDLACGVLQQLLGVFLKTALFAGYAWLYASHRLLEIPLDAAWAWVLCFVGHDFLYYWFHRASHELGAFWAAHVVHHQSEEFNLSVALRQGALQPAVSWIFYLPLAFLGFPPVMFLAVSSFDTLYQFWIHTRLVSRLGPLEWVLNTPSHHRVHHGRNPCYIDRNHGGTLIVWDRLFGTFAREEEEPVYGVTRPVASFNPLWANVHYWLELWDVARRARRPLDKLRVLWSRPGWRPADQGGPVSAPEVDRASYVKFDVPLARAVKLYVLAQFTALLVATTIYLRQSDTLAPMTRLIGAVAIIWGLSSLGGLLDRRSWAIPLEVARLAGLAASALLVLEPATAAAASALVVASGRWLILASRKGLPLPAEVR